MVTVAALRSLVAPLGDTTPQWDELLDWEQAASVAPQFKLDASFALRPDGAPSRRASINDTGEPEPFRERIERASLGVPPAFLKRFFTLSEPGEVQRTLGLKWAPDDGPPKRVSLYLEELFRSPRGPAIGDALARLALGRALPRTRAYDSGGDAIIPGAVCVDWSDEELVGVKDYRIVTETQDEAAVPLPPALEAFRRSFPLDPGRGTRRYLLARRFDRRRRVTGAKLLWMSEAHEPAAVARAWAHVARLSARHRLDRTPAARRLRALREGWSHDALLYPDLVSLDVDGAGDVVGLLVYVSVK